MAEIDETTNDAPATSRPTDDGGLSRRTVLRGATLGGLSLPPQAAKKVAVKGTEITVT
jgi:hypothetical protein